ncbi:MAG: cell division protein FtsL [Syntrophobacterales bacterium]|jgi:cell division protein FtsL
MSKKPRKKTASKSAKQALKNRRIFATVAVFVWLLLSGFGYVWCRVQVVHLGYLLSDVHRIHTQLLNDNKKLHLELARLKAPERVERIAIQQLGLRHPTKEQIVVLP